MKLFSGNACIVDSLALFCCYQVISLGAGFDSSYFRLKDNGTLSNTRILEVYDIS